MNFSSQVSAFGDQAIILPFSAAVVTALLVDGRKREALIWTVGMVGVLGLMFVLKVLFIPCGHLWPALSIRSPSGHSAASVAAFGGFGVIHARGRGLLLRTLIAAAGLLAGFAIAISRVTLDVHSYQEALLGSLIGLTVPFALWKWRGAPQGSESQRQFSRLALLPIFVPLLLVPLLDSPALHVEPLIRIFAKWVLGLLNVCTH